MFSINIIKCDYEGWWLFEDWRDNIIVSYAFKSEREMLEFYGRLVLQMKDHFGCYNIGKFQMITFFNTCDREYCEDCDDDLQMYVSPIMQRNMEEIRDETYYESHKIINYQ